MVSTAFPVWQLPIARPWSSVLVGGTGVLERIIPTLIRVNPHQVRPSMTKLRGWHTREQIALGQLYMSDAWQSFACGRTGARGPRILSCTLEKLQIRSPICRSCL